MMNLMRIFKSFLVILLFAFSINSYAGVNLNTATQSELESLPGVGQKTANEIIHQRPFASVNDLKNVKGIGDSKFEKLKSLVSVDSGSSTGRAVQGMHTKMKMAEGERVSLNNASLDQLEKLPGVGPNKAQAIIQARPFQSVEDVMKVKGIKAGVFNKIKDHITL